MRHGWFQHVGRAAARIRFNETKVVLLHGSRYWAKKRLPHSAALVVLANAYARGTGLPLRMLGKSDWLKYEAAVYQRLLGQGTVLRQGNRLLLPHLRGELLASLLASGSAEEKKRALALAVRALGRLHAQQVEHPFINQARWFSHADATVTNVLVDLEFETATWVDFETIHPASMVTEETHADDLRTLLCGVAAVVLQEELPELIEVALASYPDGRVLEALRMLFGYWHQRPALRLLAMPAPGAAQWQCLVDVVGGRRAGGR